MIRYIGGTSIAVAEDITIRSAADALDLMATVFHSGANAIIIAKDALPSGFFLLKTGLAGEILQKFSNYGMRLAIVGDFDTTSQSLAAFIRECNRGNTVFFKNTQQEAEKALDKSEV